MITLDNLPDTLAVFPLDEALLLPRARLPLHIFEPRYLTMLEDVLKTRARLIGMVQCDAREEREMDLQRIGCAGRVTRFSELEDGRAMILLSAVSRFRIVEEIAEERPYRQCRVAWTDFDHDRGPEESDEAFDRPAFMALLRRYFDQREIQTDWQALEDVADEQLINSLSMQLDLDSAEKQALLEAPDLAARRETLATLLDYALRAGNQEAVLQ